MQGVKQGTCQPPPPPMLLHTIPLKSFEHRHAVKPSFLHKQAHAAHTHPHPSSQLRYGVALCHGFCWLTLRIPVLRPDTCKAMGHSSRCLHILGARHGFTCGVQSPDIALVLLPVAPAWLAVLFVAVVNSFPAFQFCFTQALFCCQGMRYAWWGA
jgi:hypothetical protein